jgi:hypothetical protein
MFLLLDRYDVKGDGGVIVPTRFKDEFALGKFYFFDKCVYWFLSISLTLYPFFVFIELGDHVAIRLKVNNTIITTRHEVWLLFRLGF